MNSAVNLSNASLWPKLRGRLREAVKERGMKAALARDIGITRQAVNAMLNKSYTPSAEFALRLDDWCRSESSTTKQRKNAPERANPTMKKQNRIRKNSRIATPVAQPKAETGRAEESTPSLRARARLWLVFKHGEPWQIAAMSELLNVMASQVRVRLTNERKPSVTRPA